jgi:hypothetical protein
MHRLLSGQVRFDFGQHILLRVSDVRSGHFQRSWRVVLQHLRGRLPRRVRLRWQHRVMHRLLSGQVLNFHWSLLELYVHCVRCGYFLGGHGGPLHRHLPFVPYLLHLHLDS